MTDRSKFEQMLEYLISEEQEKAKEVFHQLVVEKSREIYEQILSEDFQTEEEEDSDDKEQMEAADDEESDDEESKDDSDDSDDEESDDGEVGGDATDDFMGDVGADDEEGDGAEGEGDLEDRVMDLEDALDDLRAEFEMMMGDEGDGMGDEMPGDDMGMGDEMPGDDMGGDDMGMEKPVKDEFSFSDNFMREYIEKVSEPKHGDDGVNTKSIVAGKNDMGGTTANIAKGHVENGKGGTQGGLLNPSVKDMNTGNINRPGGKAGNAFSKKEPGHGAEKAGAKETADNKTSMLNGAPKRAK